MIVSSGDIRWGFRVATTPTAGAGHFMRCLALAKALEGPVRFYLDPAARWEDVLDAENLAWQAEQCDDAAERLLAALAAGEIDAVLLDGNQFSSAMLEEVAARGFCARICDTPGRTRAHTVVAPGFDVSADGFGLPPERVLGGPAYALLRPEFATVHDEVLKTDVSAGCARHVLIAFGARDGVNATGLALDALALIKPRPVVTVVLGPDAPHLATVSAKAAALGDVNVLVDVKDMITLYRNADLAVGAGGVSLLERLCVGVPSVIVTQAEDQEHNARAAERLGVAVPVGAARNLTRDALAAVFVDLIADAARRRALRSTGLMLIDGRGAVRAARSLTQFALSHHGHQVPI